MFLAPKRVILDSMGENKQKIEISETIAVKDLAKILGVAITDLIGSLLKEGILATINDSLDFETAAIVAAEKGIELVPKKVVEADEGEDKFEEKYKTEKRPPVVTIIGHVDHGKTTLLDYIRHADVAKSESGGITQHIGSYQIEYEFKDRGTGKVEREKITFLDTPGHEAFSAIRAQGTKITDILILVVAADDGVKPQTIEAIDLAKAAKVPTIVAINKIDKPGANLHLIKGQLVEQDFATEDMGGKHPVVLVSAKSGEGVDKLLEMILLVADVEGFKSRRKGPAVGVILESNLDPKKGVTATVLVQRGGLSVGDPFVVSGESGKVKSIEDHAGKKIKTAGPSMPVQLTGFSAQPLIGDILTVAESDKEARSKAHTMGRSASAKRINIATKADLSTLSKQIKASQMTTLNVVVKTDVFGSLEAIKKSLAAIKSDKASIKIIHEGIGAINESDILTAEGQEGQNVFVIGFRVKPSLAAKKSAEKVGVKIFTYDVIYELIDDLKDLLLEAMEPEKIEIQKGKGKVLKIFRRGGKAKVIGVKLNIGEVEVGDYLRILREAGEGEKIPEGKILKIQHVNEELKKATAEGEFGFEVEIEEVPEEGEKVEFFKIEYNKPKL